MPLSLIILGAVLATGLIRVLRENLKPRFYQARWAYRAGWWGPILVIPFWVLADLVAVIDSGGRDRVSLGEFGVDLSLFAVFVAVGSAV